MKSGDKIKCEKCGEETFAVSKTRMNGWEVVGEYFTCALCGEEIESKEDTSKSNSTPEKQNLSALANFLDTEIEEKKELSVDESETHFCRDCVHYIKHPFLTRCELHKKEVNPMDDCSNFQKL